MKIEKRDLALKYPRAIKDDKTRIVLDWLLEFRFSSISVLSHRIGQSEINANRFFNSLISDGIIQRFQNVHTKNSRFVMLTSIGISYLEEYGRDISSAVTRTANLGKYSQIMHDLTVQKIVLDRIDKYTEVIWDRNIKFDGVYDRPDAVLLSDKNGTAFWSAIEYERWRKEKKRIYASFINNVRHFEKKHFSGVFYVFQNEADKKHYEKLFNESKWPMYERIPSGKLIQKNNYFSPDEVKNLRRRFVFQVQDVD